MPNNNLVEMSANQLLADTKNDIISWILARDSHLVDYPRIQTKPIQTLFSFLTTSRQFWTSLLQETYSKMPKIQSGALILKSSFKHSAFLDFSEPTDSRDSLDSRDYPKYLKIVFSFQERLFLAELYYSSDFSLARLESLYEASGNYPAAGVIPRTNILALYPESPLIYFLNN